ncbi:MAG: hypothetical protein IT429_13555 [Gemmataceae bacterium]|nr:hypothetical protein [Gemmataceae bacterium]
MADVIPFRPAAGTTARDLSDTLAVVPEGPGWSAETVEDPEAPPWIALKAPDRSAWAILREAGRFVAVEDDGLGASFPDLPTAAEAARRVVGAVMGAGGRPAA